MMPRRLLIEIPLCFLLAGCAEPPPTERYGFVALLGRDTISLESIARYPDRLVSEEVDRFPQVRRRHTEVTLAPDGSPTHMDMRVRTPSADARLRERRIVAEFRRDTVTVSLTDGSGTKRVAMATDGMLTIPHVPQMYSLIELYLAAAIHRARTGALPADGIIKTRQFYPDREFSNYPIPMHRGYVQPGAEDTVRIQHNWLAGTGLALVDSSGRMQTYSGAQTTYLVEVTRLDNPPDIAALGAQFAATEAARGPVPALSVEDTAEASIGPARLSVDYSRPLVRGRTLLGEVIPYDQVWRTGANAATHFTTSAPITIGTIVLAAGTYTLWTIPRRDGVTLIVNRQTGQWGTGYGPAHDVGRTPMTTEATATPVEAFTIAIEPRDTRTGVLALSWGPFRWTAPITVH
jgi:hypothetical protein